MQKISEFRKKEIKHLLESPFLKKNRCYTLQDASLDADLLLSYILKTTRAKLIASLDDDMDEEVIYELEHLFKRRYDGQSLAYIMEEKEFYGLSFYVNEDVLIPKADTELLVEKGILAINELSCTTDIQNVEKSEKRLNVLDVFTGSGCVAISVANSISCSHFYTLIDVSEKALEVAKRNAKRLITKQDNFLFLLHDALLAFPLRNGKKYDVILANPPYISKDEVLKLLSDGRAEPRLALDGGQDGLYFYHSLGIHAFASLNEGGILLSEIGDGQGDAVSNLFKNAGFKSCSFHTDLSGEKRVVEARK